MSVRPALTAFIQKQLAPADLVGIMYPLMPVSAMPLTRDQNKLLAAVKNFEGRKYDYQPKNAVEEQYAMYPAAVVERIRNQVTLSALEALVTHLGSLREGRKAVILVSEGFSNVLPPQLNDPVAADARPRQPGPPRHGAESIDDRAAFFANVDLQQDLRRVYDAANRNNTAIYTLDPRGLSTGRVRHLRGRRAEHRPAVPAEHARHAAHAGDRDRRPRDRQPQRPRGRAQAGRAGLVARTT